MGDISAGVLTIILFIILIFARELRENRQTYVIIAIGFILHLAIALYNGFVGPTLGGDSDTVNFLREGINIAKSGNIQIKFGSDSYRNLLGGIFYIFEPSMFLACMLSVSAYLASIFPLIRICKFLKYNNFIPHIIAAYSFLPSLNLFGSIALRESLQVCLCIFTVYFFIEFYSRRRFRYFIFAVITSVLMGMLHFGLLLFAAILIFIFTVMNYNKSIKPYTYVKSKIYSYLVLIIVIASIFMILPSLNTLGVVSVLLQGDSITEYTEQYRQSGIDKQARSGYEIQIDTSSPLGLISSLLMMLFYYIAYPFPWRVSAIIDIYASIEAIWRCILIYYSIKSWWHASGEIKKIFGILILLYFILAFIWASGTNNFGTGMRHNLTHYWIIVVLGVPYLTVSLRIFFKKILMTKYSAISQETI